jgi:hypothetical protein
MFVDETEKDLGKRRYYTLGRPIQNWIMVGADVSRLRSHVSQQKYIL